MNAGEDRRLRRPVIVLGIVGAVLGGLGAVAWHWDPEAGVWAGLFAGRVDVGYPAAGLALDLIVLVVVRPDGSRRGR